MKKKIINFSKILLGLSFTISLAMPVSAAEINGDSGTSIYANEDLDLLQDKLDTLNVPKTRAHDDGVYITLDVPVYKQETTYWCGPATTKQVMQFLNKTSPSQTTIANDLGTNRDGTDMTVIAKYLKNNTDHDYVYAGGIANDFETWIGAIHSSTKNNVPVVLDIDIDNTSVFPYTTNGHFVNTSGVDTTYSSRVRITDPYSPGLGNKWYSARDLYEVNNNHFRKAIIW